MLLPPAGLSYTSLVCDALKVDAQNPKFSSDSTVKKKLQRLTENSYIITKMLTFYKIVLIKF